MTIYTKSYFNKAVSKVLTAKVIFKDNSLLMKQVIAVVVLLSPLFTLAQDCALKKEVDPYTKEIKLTTGFIAFNDGISKTLLSIDANSTEVDFFISLTSARGGKCFDAASTAMIVFEGGRLKANYKNTGSMNCEGLFHFTFRNVSTTPSALQNLSLKKVISIRLTGNNKSITEINFKEGDQKLFSDAVACMIKESKTLLKKM